MKIEKITSLNIDSPKDIGNIITHLQNAVEKGATHLRVVEGKDPIWNYTWIETYKYKSAEEIKREEIDALEAELRYLKGK